MSRKAVRLTPDDGPLLLQGKAFVVDLDWEFAADLDLAALCIPKGGGAGQLVYYGDDGKRAEAPFAHLAHHSDGDGRSKHRREHLVISDVTRHQAIYLCVWDHDAIETGSPASFAHSPDSYEMTVTDYANLQADLNRAAEPKANCLLMGCMRGNKIEVAQNSALVRDKSDLLNALTGFCEETLEIAI